MIGSTTTTRIIINDIPLHNNLRASSGVITLNRASLAWVEDDNGVVQSYVAGAPRISPTKGLLIEEARKNELINTQAFNSASWSHQGIINGVDPTITANQAIAPDGTLSADRIDFGAVPDVASNSIVFRPQAPAGLFVQSVYLKASGSNCTVYLGHSSDGVAQWQSVACNVTSTWQRFTLPVSTTSGSLYFTLGLDGRDAGQPTPLAAASVYAWNPQMEVGTFTTSMIDAGAAQVTRIIEVPLCTTNNWPVKEGSIEFKYTPVATRQSGVAGVFSLFDSRIGAQNDGVLIYFGDYGSGVLSFYFVNPSGATSTSSAALTWTAGVTYTIKCVWNKGNVFGYRDGVLIASNVTGLVKIPTQHAAISSIGATPGFTAACCGWIKDFKVSRS